MNRMTGLVALVAVALSALSTTASAEKFDFSIGHNSFRAALNGPLSRVLSGTNGQYEVGAVMRPKRTDDLLVAHAGALVTGDAGMQNFNLAAGLGMRAAYIGRDHDSGAAFALGGQTEARFPGYERVGLSLYGYYAPDILTTGEFDRYYEIGTAVDYQVLKNASVYAGYRNINVKLSKGGDLTADNGIHVGMRLSF